MGTGGSKGFQDGVKSVTNLPIVFLNPTDFHRQYFLDNRKVHPDDITKAREVIRGQGVDDSGFNDKQLETLVRRSLAGPFGHAMEVDNLQGKKINICLANGPEGSINGHNDVLLQHARINLQKVSVLPGWEQYRERIFGIHEGTHCGQDMNTKGMTDEQKDIFLLGREAEGDRAAVKWLRDNKLSTVAQYLIDIRALTAVEDRDDPRHATAILIDNPTVAASQAHIDAARDLKFQMVSAVMNDRRINMEQAVDMFTNRRAEFVGHVDRILARGGFSPAKNPDVDNNPFVEQYIRAYAGAYRRQIIERPLTPTPAAAPATPPSTSPGTPSGAPVQQPASAPSGTHGSLETAGGEDSAHYAATTPEEPQAVRSETVKVSLAEGDRAVLTINGMSAQDYWRQIADRDIAQQRLETSLQTAALQGEEVQPVSQPLKTRLTTAVA